MRKDAQGFLAAVSALLRLTAAQVKDLRALTSRAERRRQGRYLAEGDHLTGEAIREGAAAAIVLMEGLEEKFRAYGCCGLPVYLLPERAFLQISDTKSPQGIAAICALPEGLRPGDLGERIVALNAVQDPGNVGAIIRSADAAGFSGIMMDENCADPFSPKALRASMGSAMRIPVSVCPALADGLRMLRGYDIIAGALDGAPFYKREETAEKVCLLIGNEGAGLSGEVLALATMRLKLPMRGGAESLNAACAAAVMMYDFVRVWEESV